MIRSVVAFLVGLLAVAFEHRGWPQTEAWPQPSRYLDSHVWYSADRPTTQSMVLIPGGEYLLGSLNDDNVGAARAVRLEPFFILEHEVCNKQYQEFLDYTSLDPPRLDQDFESSWAIGQIFAWHGRSYPPGRAGFPVVGITKSEAEAFCKWLSEKTKILHRLPTDEEWESAYRGASGNLYPWGREWNEQMAVSVERHMHVGPDPFYAATDDVTPLGVMHLFGNVAEFTSSSLEESVSPDSPPRVVDIIRGSSYTLDAGDYARALKPVKAHAGHRAFDLGFRYVIPVRDGKLQAAK